MIFSDLIQGVEEKLSRNKIAQNSNPDPVVLFVLFALFDSDRPVDRVELRRLKHLVQRHREQRGQRRVVRNALETKKGCSEAFQINITDHGLYRHVKYRYVV
jgi:hypothetical protein